MPQRIGSVVIKVVLASFLVGVVLAFLDVNPQDILKNFSETALQAFQAVADILEWAVGYILLGAVVVVPIWLVVFVVNAIRGKSGG